ncbi:MAG: iron-containing alcohol dehydrogenase [Pseudomonadota bacterium]
MSFISYLTRIHFAELVLEDALGEEVARLGAARPVIVIDADGRIGDGVGRLESTLPAECVLHWADWIDAWGRLRDPEAIRAKAADDGCDVIVAFGGREAQAFGRRLAGQGRPRLPLIAVPTTTADMGVVAGTPSSRRDAVHTAMPAAVLCDPTLTYGLDPRRTAAFGFGALTRSIEAFLAPGYNPPADGIALEGIHRASRYLARAVDDGADPEARREVMAAALNGALAGQKGLGGAEALARAIEVESREALPHGQLHASVLPPVLSFNAPAVGDRYGRIATAMGAKPGSDLIAALADLAGRLGLPEKLGHLGLGPTALRRAALGAAADLATQTNPRHATEEDYLRLLLEAR